MILIRLLFGSFLIFKSYHETGFWTATNLILNMAAIEMIVFKLKEKK